MLITFLDSYKDSELARSIIDRENLQVLSDQSEYNFVKKVIDGDTIELSSGDKVRYIGIDTPEIDDGGGCYSWESFLKNKELVEGKEVELRKDVSERDRFGRLLRYVFVENIFVNEYLVKTGYAFAVKYPPDVLYSGVFENAEASAQLNRLGLWSECDLGDESLDL